MKSEARRPRAERRPSSEIRRPKPEAEGSSGFDLRVSAFGFDPRGYKQDAPNGAFRTQPFSVPIGIAARFGGDVRMRPYSHLPNDCAAAASPSPPLEAEGWGEEAPAIFRDYPARSPSWGREGAMADSKWPIVGLRESTRGARGLRTFWFFAVFGGTGGIASRAIPEATLRPSGSRPVGTPEPPESLPSGYPEATAGAGGEEPGVGGSTLWGARLGSDGSPRRPGRAPGQTLQMTLNVKTCSAGNSEEPLIAAFTWCSGEPLMGNRNSPKGSHGVRAERWQTPALQA